ncbi:MAG: glutathione S-transferase family protein [Litorimonas sp.]
MSDIKLYGYSTSPFVRKVAACLYYKNLPFEHVPVNPVDPDKTIGFTGKRQVPVLSIGDDWKVDSTPIAIWLDEVYPERPLLPSDPQQRAKILKIDDWMNKNFLPSYFRGALDAKKDLAFKYRAWRLAALVSAHTPLPENIRHMWPDILQMAPFIVNMVNTLDREESLQDMHMRLGMEMIMHLGDGPFLGSSQTPTLVDLALFPQLVFPYMAGLADKMPTDAAPPLKAWTRDVAKHLPKNPILIPDDFVVAYLD